MMKTKSIKLQHVPKTAFIKQPQYKVIAVTDSIDYTPHQHLDPHEVKTLCAKADWKVTIVGK
jgi:hypothetical protein